MNRDNERGPIGAPPAQVGHHATAPTTIDDRHDIGEQLRRRREASYRLPPLESGVRDPISWPYETEAAERAAVVAARGTAAADRAAAVRAWHHLRSVGLMSEHVLDILRRAA